MKQLVTRLAIATSIALATLAVTEAAYAQSTRPAEAAAAEFQRPAEAAAAQSPRPAEASRPAGMTNGRVVGEGNYEGDYDFNVDRNDRASSPYAGGGD